MKKWWITGLSLCFCISYSLSQNNCIQTDTMVCLTACIPVMYTGSAPDTALYTWSSNCGTFENPTQQNPGNHCAIFQGAGLLQLIVQEDGMQPDTCTFELTVNTLPDGVISGDATICSGLCSQLIITFLSGVPPYAYSISDGTFINFYTSSDNADTIPVCPSFTTTYTLESITDGNGCTSPAVLNSIEVQVIQGIAASITQNGQMLCANPPGQNYLWYNCDYSTLYSNTSCMTLPSDGCFCVLVSDAATGFCVDTVCGDFILPCSLTCGIEAPDSVCQGSEYMFVYSGNASDTALFQWIIEIDTIAPDTIEGLDMDSIVVSYDGDKCVIATLSVTDAGCTTICVDSICPFPSPGTAGFGQNLIACDSCIEIPILLSGIPPFQLILSDGISNDTIIDIPDTIYFHSLCSPPDTTLTIHIIAAFDSVSFCPLTVDKDSIDVSFYTTPMAGITQNGNTLCATFNSPFYNWYDCDLMQLLSFDSCLTILDTGCYCLIVSSPICADTICGTFDFIPCALTCDISMPDTACIHSTVTFAYTGNASSAAVYNWLIDIPGFPMMSVTGNDTVIFPYETPGCYGVSVSVFDAGCISNCTDTVCIVESNSEVSLCCDQMLCDTCAILELQLNGNAPFNVVLTDGLSTDTISNILTSPYLHTVCPSQDSTYTYTIVQATDQSGVCASVISGDSVATVFLGSTPQAAITQMGDTLCASSGDGLTYGWYACPFGIYLDTSRCFVPQISGCYCVDVVSASDCVDTACFTIILSDIYRIEEANIRVSPNPSSSSFIVQLDNTGADVSQWSLYDLVGQSLASGYLNAGNTEIEWPFGCSEGLFFLRIFNTTGNQITIPLIYGK